MSDEIPAGELRPAASGRGVSMAEGLAAIRPWMLVALAMALTAAVRVRLLEIPLERDEGEFAYVGQLMLHGIPPYLIAFNMKFPGTYAAYAAIMAVFGQTTTGIHVGLLLVNAATIVLVYLLGKRLLSAAAGVAACAAYAVLSLSPGVYGMQAHATHFVVLAAVGGTLLLVRACDRREFSVLFWSGTLYGVAILMKQHGALFTVFAAVYLGWDHFTGRDEARAPLFKKLGIFALGFAAPLEATALALWWDGVFGRFWFWTVAYARQYATELKVSDGIGMFLITFPRVTGANLAIWIMALAGLVLLWIRKGSRPRAAVLTSFLICSFLAVCPGFYFREHYFVLMLPAVALLAGAAMHCLSEILPRGALAAGGLFGAALLVPLVQQQEVLFQLSPLDCSRSMYGANPFAEAIQIADYIRANSEKDARIAVLGSEPEIPFYANRLAATGYLYVYPLMEDQPYALTMQDEFIQQVESARPEYVVFVNIATSWLARQSSPKRIFEWWKGYYPQHYVPVGVADILSEDFTEYKWGDVAGYRPQSPNVIWVLKRKEI